MLRNAAGPLCAAWEDEIPLELQDGCPHGSCLVIITGCCPLCNGWCTNGAECGISQLLGRGLDWRSAIPCTRGYAPELIPRRVPPQEVTPS